MVQYQDTVEECFAKHYRCYGTRSRVTLGGRRRNSVRKRAVGSERPHRRATQAPKVPGAKPGSHYGHTRAGTANKEHVCAQSDMAGDVRGTPLT